MNILTIVILAVFFLFVASGWRKGLVKKLAGIVALALSSFLVSIALPYITEFIKSETPVYQYIVQQCGTVLNGDNVSYWMTGQKKDSSIDREEIRSLLDYYGMDSSLADTLSDGELESLVNQYFQEYMAQSAQDTSLSMTKVEQTKLIQNLPVPDFLKEMLLNYNNSEGYRKLGVTDFAGYLVNFFANIILNILAFIVTLLVVQLVLWTGIAALDLFSRLPVLNLINHLGGLVVGAIQGLFVVWLIFLVISLLSATQSGLSLMNMVNESTLLQPMYESNLFLKIVVEAISKLM